LLKQLIPTLGVTVGTNETANWYDGSGVLLSSGSTSYTPSASGTYYAEAQNISNGCRSSSKTAVKLTINAVPNLTVSNKNCSSDLKTYNLSFTSDGTVTSDYGVVSGNVVSGIPSGQSVTLTATSVVVVKRLYWCLHQAVLVRQLMLQYLQVIK
jgi:hypothetical protein